MVASKNMLVSLGSISVVDPEPEWMGVGTNLSILQGAQLAVPVNPASGVKAANEFAPVVGQVKVVSCTYP